MNIVIDAGNSWIKIACFEKNELIQRQSISPHDWRGYISGWKCPDAVSGLLLSSVRHEPVYLPEWSDRIPVLVRFDHNTVIPIQVDYETRETLGPDRIANAVAAINRYGSHTLVIDCGTCITYTFVRDHALQGGAISPGIGLRFRALHEFTGNLPLLSSRNPPISILGKSTDESIRSGVLHGILSETDQNIAQWCSKEGVLHVIITGGDTSFFAERLKSRIFADPDLTLKGLNDILNTHIEHS